MKHKQIIPFILILLLFQLSISVVEAQFAIPTLRIAFSSDTFEIDPVSNTVEITGDVILDGHSINAVENLSNLSFQIEYDGSFVLNNSTQLAYDDYSWFGSSNTVQASYESLPNGNSNGLQVSYTRLGQLSSSGKGRIATFSFIIIDDLLERDNDGLIYFPVRVSNVSATNQAGQSVPLMGITTTVLLKRTVTMSTDADWAAHIALYPNPAADILQIDLADARLERLRLFDELGRLHLDQQQLNEGQLRLPNHLNNGMYFLQIETNKGSFSRILQVQR